jgi:hypothetical protein
MYESIYKKNELENEVSLNMSYFWCSDVPSAKALELWKTICFGIQSCLKSIDVASLSVSSRASLNPSS